MSGQSIHTCFILAVALWLCLCQGTGSVVAGSQSAPTNCRQQGWQPDAGSSYVADEAKAVVIKPVRWRLTSIPEASWCEPAHQVIASKQLVNFGQLTAELKGTSIVLSGIFKVLKTAEKPREYLPTVFFKAGDKPPAKTDETLSAKQLDASVDVEVCGADGTGAGIRQFTRDWRGVVCGPVSGWKFQLNGESITVVDGDLNGLLTVKDKMMYEGRIHWMPWHTVTCDKKLQYYELAVGPDATLTGKTLPLGDLGENADLAAEWNEARKANGLPPGVFDATLTAACKKHADYLKLNALMAHEEDPKLPGYSDDGALAGLSSNITFSGKAEAVSNLLRTLYHRAEILNPREDILQIGGNDYAYLLGLSNRPNGLPSKLPTENRRWHQAQLNPAPATTIDWARMRSELPTTPAELLASELGCPAWLRLWKSGTSIADDALANVKAELRSVQGAMKDGRAGTTVKCHLSYPGFQVPEDCKHNYDLIALVPLAPLTDGVYEAHVTFKHKKAAYDFRWRFEVSIKNK